MLKIEDYTNNYQKNKANQKNKKPTIIISNHFSTIETFTIVN